MPRRALTVLALALALAVSGTRAEAQLDLGLHAAKATDLFGGTWGAGASLRLGLPMVPVSFMVAGEYFRPDCDADEDCSLRSASVDVRAGLGLPLLSPYVLGGITVRRIDVGDGSGAVSHTGPTVGVGLDLGTIVLGAYAEVRYEFVDPEDQALWRLGIRF